MLMCEYKGCGDKRKKCSAKVCVQVGIHSLGSVLCKRKRCSVNKKGSKGSSVA